MRGLFSRNNKTAFQQVECRFAGNPLYQPGIWTPSKTRARRAANVSDCINLRFGHLRRLCSAFSILSSDCINLGFGHLRRPRASLASAMDDCINLGFGHLRGLFEKPVGASSDCINLGFGHFRGPSSSCDAPPMELYQPGIWTPSRTRRTRLRPYRELYQPGIWTPSRTPPKLDRHPKTLYQPES